MSFTQTVDIPASRRLVIDVPSEVPLGRAVITFSVAESAPAYGTEQFVANPYTAIENLRGLAKRMGSTVTVEQFLEMRREDLQLEEEKFRRYFEKQG